MVEASCEDGDIVSDGEVLLLKQVDQRLGLSHAAAYAWDDDRRSVKVVHSVQSLLEQRIYSLRLGWSHIRDHNVLHQSAGRDRQPREAVVMAMKAPCLAMAPGEATVVGRA